jgi:hypothetical protein
MPNQPVIPPQNASVSTETVKAGPIREDELEGLSEGQRSLVQISILFDGPEGARNLIAYYRRANEAQAELRKRP